MDSISIRAVAWILLRKDILKQRIKKKKGCIHVKIEIDVEMNERAEREILKIYQKKIFSEETEALQSNESSVKGSSSICKLEHFLDQNGLFHVRWKLKNSIHKILLL